MHQRHEADSIVNMLPSTNSMAQRDFGQTNIVKY